LIEEVLDGDFSQQTKYHIGLMMERFMAMGAGWKHGQFVRRPDPMAPGFVFAQ
jgi:hypothetical protein